MSKVDERIVAAKAIRAVLDDGRSCADVLDERSGGFVQALVYGVLRHRTGLCNAIDPWLKKPFKPKDHTLYYLLLIAAFQVATDPTRRAKVVNETVEAIKQLKANWASGIANAILRKIDIEQVLTHPSHPGWLQRALKRDWPEHHAAILAENNHQAPMWLRVNATRFSALDDYLAKLDAANIAYRLPLHQPGWAVALVSAMSVNEIPGFTAGEVSVQDLSAQWASALLSPAKEARVLDACAAPGGKSSALIEQCPSIALTAVDVDATRVDRMREGFSRLNHSVTSKVADLQSAKIGSFDAILADVPCSATGVIRRHPDIKWNRYASDIRQLVELQQSIVDNLWQQLVSGGQLLYTTCSVLQSENEAQVLAFLDRHSDAVLQPLNQPWAQTRPAGIQVFPSDGDGFYYALIRKR
ncbi:MAG: 16S rRNA (cytosine(967)-C(5))-methyltransferase RsmB [Gammaproteobacteria bacterium]|nr:16S rRNA (cytosine(967)-C(5))-methyltransferase RsmB [Gammaproteobacteria bacterium]